MRLRFVITVALGAALACSTGSGSTAGPDNGADAGGSSASGTSGSSSGAGSNGSSSASVGSTASTSSGSGAMGSPDSAAGGSAMPDAAAEAGPSQAELMAAASVLDGFTLLKPCDGWTFSMQNNMGDCCCNEDPQYENQHITKTFGGDPSITYNVQVRIAGVAERYWYAGGMLDPVSLLFYTGGLPTIHGPPCLPDAGSCPPPNNVGLMADQGACKIHPPQTDGPPDNYALGFIVPPEIDPSDGCFNGFNIFAMTVSSPKKSYYLNFTSDYDGIDRQPHAVYTDDYTVTIPIAGQAQVDFYIIDGDHHEVTNNGLMMVPNVKTAQPYNGNFLEFTVLGVAAAN